MRDFILCLVHLKRILGNSYTTLDADTLRKKIINEDYSENLVITDDSQVFEFCRRYGVACGVLLHDGNREQHFPMGAYCIEGMEDVDKDYLLKIYQREKKLPWIILETDRLILREITLEDVPRLYELYNDTSVTKYMEPLFTDLQEELEYTKEYIKNIYGFYGYGIWLVILKETGEIIGRAGVESKDSQDGLEMGFMLGVEYQHKGYAYEICDAIIKYSHDELDEHNIRAMVHPDNQASIKLCEKLGFTTDGKIYGGYLRFE